MSPISGLKATGASFLCGRFDCRTFVRDHVAHALLGPLRVLNGGLRTAARAVDLVAGLKGLLSTTMLPCSSRI